MAAAAGAAIAGYLGVTAPWAVAAIQIGTGIALSAAAAEIVRRQQTRPRAPGIQGEFVGKGDTTPQTIILGRMATAGHQVAPRYTHRWKEFRFQDPPAYGDTNTGSQATFIRTIGDAPITGLRKIFINGEEFSWGDRLQQRDAGDPYGWTVAGSDDDYDGRFWAKFYDGTQTQVDQYLLDAYGGHNERPWKATSILRGAPYMILTLRYNEGVWQNLNMDEVLYEVDGMPLLDPRTGVFGFTDNPMVMIWNLMRGIDLPGGKTYGVGVEEEDLPAEWWFPAMDACDELVPDVDGNMVPRFRAGIEIPMASPDADGMTPLDAIDELLSACVGKIADIGGTWICRAGPPGLSVHQITDQTMSVLRTREYEAFGSVKDAYNGALATFPDARDQWNARSSATFKDPVAIQADGRELLAQITINTVSDEDQIQRMLPLLVADAQQRRTLTLPLPYTEDRAGILDVIAAPALPGADPNKLFDVQTRTLNPATGEVMIEARETDPADFDVDPANYVPRITPVNSASVGAPVQMENVVAESVTKTVTRVNAQGEPVDYSQVGLLVTFDMDTQGITGIAIDGFIDGLRQFAGAQLSFVGQGPIGIQIEGLFGTVVAGETYDLVMTPIASDVLVAPVTVEVTFDAVSVLTDLQDNQSGAIVVYEDDTGFSFVNADDVTGSAVDVSFTAGSILEVGSVKAVFVDIDGFLTITDADSGFLFGKTGPNDFANSGVAMTNYLVDGEIDHVFFAGRNDDGVESYVRVSASGVEIRNARFYSNSDTSITTEYVASQTIDLTGAERVQIDLTGGAGGGGGGAGSEGDNGGNGGAGGNTTVLIRDGDVVIESHVAEGGLGGAAGTDFETSNSSISPFGGAVVPGDGGEGGQGGYDTNASGFGQRRRYSRGEDGDDGSPGTSSFADVDLTDYAAPNMQIIIGPGGNGGVRGDTSGGEDGTAGGDGADGRVVATVAAVDDIRTFPMAAEPAAVGTFSVVAGVAGQFPDLTISEGIWLLSNVPAGFNATASPSALNPLPNQGGDGQNMTIVASERPSYSADHTSSAPINYAFYPMGSV